MLKNYGGGFNSRLMGPLVGAAGSLLGSYAGSKLMNKIDGPPRTYGPDTKVPGIISATIKPGSKKGDVPAEKIAQVDPSQALSWFKQAGEEQSNYYTKGLDYYQNALKLASVEITAGYKKSNETLAPMSFSANQALNEQMRMMGLDPISSSHAMKSQAAEVGVSSEVLKQISDAESIKDPAARAAAKTAIMSGIEGQRSQNQKSVKELQDKMNGITNDTFVGGGRFDDNTLSAFGNDRLPRPVGTQAQYANPVLSRAQYDAAKKAGFEPGMRAINPDGSVQIGDAAAFNNYLDSIPKLQADNAAANSKTKSDLQSQIDALNLTNSTLSDFGSVYNSTYSDKYDAGYTGSQVEEKVAATPGYQFQMDQGTKAIERQGAAKGMLGSGNTLIGLTNYGQGLAQNFYGVYMDNLSRIVAEGSPGTMGIAANQANLGKDYGNLIAAGGQAGMDTNKAIGDAKANSLANQSAAYMDAAKFNATAQNQAIKDGKYGEKATSTQGIASGASYIAANTQANQFNYGLFQQQQQGAAFAGTGASGWPQYDTKTQQWK